MCSFTFTIAVIYNLQVALQQYINKAFTIGEFHWLKIKNDNTKTMTSMH